MENKYKANVNISNYNKNNIILFGYYFDYNKIYSKYIRFYKKLITIKIYKIVANNTCLVTDVNNDNLIKGYKNSLNNRLSDVKAIIKRDNKICISLYKYIISLTMTNNKKYNEERAFKKLNNIVLE